MGEYFAFVRLDKKHALFATTDSVKLWVGAEVQSFEVAVIIKSHILITASNSR